MHPEDVVKNLCVTPVESSVPLTGDVPGSTSWMVITYHCNSHCAWCYAKKNIALKDSHIPLHRAKRIIDLLAAIGIDEINLIGGEPTLHPHFFEIIEYCNELDTVVSITTNGRKLSNSTFFNRLTRLNMGEIVISIESHDPHVHDRITNAKGSFNQALTALKNCMDGGLRYKVDTVVSQSNRDHIMESIMFFNDMGAERMDLDMCNPPLYGPCGEILSPQENVKIFSDVVEQSRDFDIVLGFDNIGPFCLYTDETIDLLRRTCSFSGNSCDIIAPHIIVDYKGDLLPCCQFVDMPFGTLLINGELIATPEKFFTVWESERAKAFRKHIFRYPSEKCMTCSNWEECIGGGCPLTWLYYNPDDHIKGTAGLCGMR